MNLPRSASRLLFIAAIATPACTPAIRAASSEVPKTATPALADASLKVLEDPRTRERLAEVLATPEVQRALAELSAGLSTGVVQGLSRAELADHLTVLVDRLTRALLATLADDLKDLQPAAQKLAAAISASIVRSASDEIARSLGPSMRAAMEHDVAPALAAMLRTPEFRAALGEASHEIARQAVYGSNEALGALADQRKQVPNGPLGAMSDFLEKRTWLVVLIALSAAFAVPLTWLVKERAAARRYHEQAERRAAETAALVRALAEVGDGALSRDLVAILKRQFEPEAAAEERTLSRGPPTHRPRHA